jgi:transcriptional regulator with XRE-family HTH domain
MTLQEIRVANNLTQFQVAEMLKVSQPEICNYERGTMTPDLENAVILENLFSARIHWIEKYTPKQKADLIQAVIELCQKYPLPMVFEACSRWYRKNESPENMIQHYGKLASEGYEPPLGNPDVIKL